MKPSLMTLKRISSRPKPSPQEKYPWLTAELESRPVEIMTEVLAEKDGYSKEDLENNDELEDRIQNPG